MMPAVTVLILAVSMLVLSLSSKAEHRYLRAEIRRLDAELTTQRRATRTVPSNDFCADTVINCSWAP